MKNKNKVKMFLMGFVALVILISLSGCGKKVENTPAPQINTPTDIEEEIMGLPNTEVVPTTTTNPDQETVNPTTKTIKSSDIKAALSGLDDITVDDSDDSADLDSLEEADDSSDIDSIEE